MNIHEYQAKALFRSHGLPVLNGIPVATPEAAQAAAEKLGGGICVVKAQIHAGGRGKAGGVKLAHSPQEAKAIAASLLGSVLVTRQTGPKGKRVERLYVEQGAQVAKELYCAVLVDRVQQKICVMASPAGGMEIEDVARTTPELIQKAFIDPVVGFAPEEAERLAQGIGLAGDEAAKAADFFQKLYTFFFQADASLVEVNPLAFLADGRLVALDAKVVFDDNALFRHPEYEVMRDITEEDPLEVHAHDVGLNYVALDGDIACMVNGAGLAMATMDTIKLYGGNPANFLDVGGGSDLKKVTAAFQIMLSNPKIRAILVNIFGGIMRCDVIAQGLVTAMKGVKLTIPLVVRMSGTNEEQARAILASSPLKVISASNLDEAARKAVEAAHEHGVAHGERA